MSPLFRDIYEREGKLLLLNKSIYYDFTLQKILNTVT